MPKVHDSISEKFKIYRPPMCRAVTRTESVSSSRAFGITKVNQYTLLKKVGLGAFGDVFMGIEPAKKSHENDKTFAIKIVKKSKIPGFDSGHNSVFLNELNALKGLYHPHIVQLKEVINDPESPLLYLVMQFLPGMSFQDKLDSVGENELIGSIE